jgi:DNA-binding GntR family transcriptional regulator
MRSLRSSPSADIRSARAPRRPGGRSELPNGYRVEEAYRHLKTRIMSANLPPGASLNELEIAAPLGTSRTPVREAIRKLEQEGLAMWLKARDALAAMEAMRRHLESARQSLVLLA